MTDYLSREMSARRNLYCNLMEEVRSRIDLVSAASSGSFLGLPQFAAYELCQLQFRLICELIALGALAAHGDIPATQSGRLTKAYQADFILNALEKLHPDFYPKPGKQVLGSNGRPKHIDLIKSGFLTKEELLSLYHRCGDILHRGTMRTVKPRTVGDFNEINETNEKIRTLLNHHQIVLSDSDYMMIVVMMAKEDGKVHAALAMRIDGLPQTN
jgi:hypothetical protein